MNRNLSAPEPREKGPERLLAPPASRNCLDLAALARLPADSATLSRGLVAARTGADDRLNRAFDDGADIRELVRSRAWVLEQLVLNAWERLAPAGAGFDLAAVGGFGRGELHPHSDVDLLILAHEDVAYHDEALESFVRVLWDAGLHPGQGVRTVAECAELAAADVSVATNLMEARLLAGDGALFTAMRRATDPPALWPANEFFAAKIAEQNERHEQFEDTVYNLEPNIKDGPGGLRDIQTIAWVTRRHFGTSTLHGLVDRGFLSEREYDDLAAGRARLWTIRWALHQAAGRAEERLLFEHQRALAERMGFDGGSGANVAVEKFMQRYYRTVMQLERLNERLLQSFDEELLAGRRHLPSGDVDEDFRTRHGYLELIDPQAFVRRPALIMRLFLVMAEHPEIRGVRASTIRLVREHLYLIDEDFRRDPEVLNTFMALLRRKRGVYSQLERMNRYGVLAAFLPAFGRITGRMQFDLFHVYTVDQHVLFVIRNLRRFAYGKYADVFRHADEVFRRIDRPEVLYLAALFHDIAKGRGGDHSELGAQEAKAFLIRLDMREEDRELVVWLVREHLSMSRTAQREDITNPEVVSSFARKVGDQGRLDHLYVLTVADIAATSPQLWNAWKDSLVWELYQAAGKALRRGADSPVDRELIIRETREAAHSRLVADGCAPADIERIWAALPESAFLRLDDGQFAWTTARVLGESGRPLVCARGLPDKGITELFVHTADFDGLFAVIAREFDRMHINVLAARVVTTRDAMSWDVFQVMDSGDEPLNDSDARRLQASLVQRLAEKRARPLPARPIPRRLQPFLGRSEIAFEDDGGLTSLEIAATDRPGLLSAIAEALVACKLRLHDARVATFGQRVEDVFLITDAHRRVLNENTRAALEAELRSRLDPGSDQ